MTEPSTGQVCSIAVAALEGVTVYPNPAADVITIEGMGKGTYTISNAIGQRLLQGSLSSQKQSINIAALPTGSYLLLLSDANGNRGAMPVLRQ
jgi:hypothetical protein